MKFLKYIIILILVFFLGFFLKKIDLFSFLNPTAKLTFISNPVKNFEEIKLNDKAVFYFVFKNTGNEDLKIIDTKTKCGCTISSLGKESFKPGEIDSIKVEYDTSILGPFNRTINVYSNAKNNLEFLHIKGVVLKE